MRTCGDCGSPASACICRDDEPPTERELAADWAEYHPELEADERDDEDDDEGGRS